MAAGRRTVPGEHRPHALLVGLVAGGLVAGIWQGAPGRGDHGSQDPAVTVALADALSPSESVVVEPDGRAQISEAEARSRLDQLAASRAARVEQERPTAVLPVDGRLSSGFGARWGTTHYGLDFAAPMLTQEVAAADGVVLRAGAASGFGLAVYIQHENGDVTVYGHMEEIQVRAGDVVSAGDPIALLGNRGQSTGPHLHFEVHQGGMDGRRVDPAEWLAERGVTV